MVEKIVIQSLQRSEAAEILRLAKAKVEEEASRSLTGKALWSLPGDGSNSEASLRVWGSRRGSYVEVWMTLSPQANINIVGDTRAIQSLMRDIFYENGRFRIDG